MLKKLMTEDTEGRNFYLFHLLKASKIYKGEDIINSIRKELSSM